MPLFFLMGPVRGGGDWQQDMCAALAVPFPDCVIAVPTRYEKTHPLMEHLMHPGMRPQAFPRQLDWERYLIEKAALPSKHQYGCVITWLGEQKEPRPPEQGPYAQDTYGELGELRGRMIFDMGVRLVVGAEPKFHGLDTIQRNFEHVTMRPFPIYYTMEEVAKAAIDITLAN